MTEKYARMMQYTSPCECRGIGQVLPELEAEVQDRLHSLMVRSLRWREAVEQAQERVSREYLVALLTEFQGIKTDRPATSFFTNDFAK